MKQSNTKKILYSLCIVLYLLDVPIAKGQTISSKGKEFWIGFTYHPKLSNGNTRRCEIFITSELSTMGTISIPNQGWNQTFIVNANQTTIIPLSVPQVENILSEIIENKGIQIITQDTVSVFAITYEVASADAAVIYPKQSLGTEYRISSYRNVNNIQGSLFLIVATEDGTQIEITPTASTQGGKPAGLSFIVNLNSGESYQVIAATSQEDLTGSVIKATDSSGTCRPFAVFSGSASSIVPFNCAAGDALYDQALPVNFWGNRFHAVPFYSTSSYTLRIMADQDSTSYSINSGASATLNSGQFVEINGITDAKCIFSTKPVSVIQYMEGTSCAGAGDPSMMYLNASNQKIDKITFSTVASNTSSQNYVNVIMNTSHINQLTLNGSVVQSSLFTPLNSCSNYSFAQIPLTFGSHTLIADSGFIGYVYGVGSSESYAYSVGSFNQLEPITPDTIFCTSDTLILGTNNIIYNPWWSTITSPQDTISVGSTVTLTPPIIPDIYILNGHEYLSGCEKQYHFIVGVPDAPLVQITSNSINVCQNQQVQLFATTTPASSVYSYSWTPVTGLNNPNIANPILTATTSMWYKVAVTTPDSCAPVVYDSMYVSVQPLPLPNVIASGNQTICYGQSATLSASGVGSYFWHPGGATTSNINVSPTTNTDYIVYLTDSNGCQNSDTVSVIVFSVPNIRAGIDQTICDGSSAILEASGALSYLWYPTGDTSNLLVVSPNVSTNYVVQTTGPNGCQNSDTVQVIVNSLPIINAGPDQSICEGDTIELIANGGVSYLWLPGGQTTSHNIVTPSITQNFIVIALDSNNCENSDTVNIAVHPNPSTSFTISDPVCEKTNVYFSNTSAITTGVITNYNWIFGDGDTSDLINPQHNYNLSANYQVQLIAISDKGCTDSISHNISVNPHPDVDFYTQNICANQPLQFYDLSNVSSGTITQWHWQFGDGSLSSDKDPVHIYLNDGIYNITLTVTSDSGCTSTYVKTEAVEVYPLPIADFSYKPINVSIINPYVYFNDQSIGGDSWYWNFGDNHGISTDQNPVYIYSDTGVFNVFLIVQNIYGCTDTAKGQLFIEPYFSIYFPNSFTPNKDGINDYFIPVGTGIVEFEMLIFNRWGEKLFHTNNIDNKWDGAIQSDSNKNCSEGVYVYRVFITDNRKKSHEYTGKVLLFR